MKDILRPILELLVVLPGLLLGYFPVKTYLKQSPGRLAAWLFPLMACLCIGSGLACYRLHASTVFALAGVALAAICLYTGTLTISLWKSGTIALSVCAVFACVNSLSRAVSAAIIRNLQLPPDGPWLCLGACVFYNAVCWVIVLAAYYPATHTVRAMVEDDNFAQTWYVFWVLPLAFILLNLFMIPRYQSTLQTGRVLQGYIVLSSALLVFMFCFLAKSQEMRAVGKAAIVPVCFAVNEPLLFAAPIILNPYFLIPFLFAPVANVLIGKFFIDFLGMNGFIYAMPWALPGPIGTFIDTNFQPISLVLVVVLLVVDFLIYYPFCKAYDNVLCKQEAETLAEEEADETKTVKTADAPAVEAPVVETASATETSAAPSALKGKDLRVLVLCAGAGTSALLANALKEGADELGIDITANAGAYGSHYAIMDQYNVIVLAPQVRTYYNEMKADTDRLGITLLSPKGKQYIDLTKDPKGAVAWIEENLEA